MVRRLRSSCGAAVFVFPAPNRGAARSDSANLGNCCTESPRSVKAGNFCEEPRPSEPESNPLRIANAKTRNAVIHAIRTTKRPADLASDELLTMTAVFRDTQF
jgi:hypothetical protein